MARKRKNFSGSGDADVPLSAMIDIVFLLLIYFIVTQKPIVEDTLLGVNLPGPGRGAPKDKPVQLFTVDVMQLPGQDSDNIYHLNGRPLLVNDLRQTLKDTAKIDPDITIIVNCGPNPPHKKLIKLLDMCNEAGLKSLNILNDESVQFVPFSYSKEP